MSRASDEDRAYFARVAAAERRLEDGSIPATLAEMFDRLEEIRRTHGALAEPGVDGDDDGDLASHLALLAALRRRPVGTPRPR